jgi:hypothetical protein
LKTVFFTRKPGTKALGWEDSVLMQTMRNPQLLPCGHIADQESALALGYCALDRQKFKKEQLITVNPRITRLDKGISSWFL